MFRKFNSWVKVPFLTQCLSGIYISLSSFSCSFLYFQEKILLVCIQITLIKKRRKLVVMRCNFIISEALDNIQPLLSELSLERNSVPSYRTGVRRLTVYFSTYQSQGDYQVISSYSLLRILRQSPSLITFI